MAELLAIGVSHKTAPLELREKMALTEGHAAGLLGELSSADVVQEAATISTCNRTEIYLFASDGVAAESLAQSISDYWTPERMRVAVAKPMPRVVKNRVETSIAPALVSRVASGPSIWAIPKSTILMLPSVLIRTFSGFRSR